MNRNQYNRFGVIPFFVALMNIFGADGGRPKVNTTTVNPARKGRSIMRVPTGDVNPRAFVHGSHVLLSRPGGGVTRLKTARSADAAQRWCETFNSRPSPKLEVSASAPAPKRSLLRRITGR